MSGRPFPRPANPVRSIERLQRRAMRDLAVSPHQDHDESRLRASADRVNRAYRRAAAWLRGG